MNIVKYIFYITLIVLNSTQAIKLKPKSISFVGDIMIGRRMNPTLLTAFNNDYSKIFEHMTPIFNQSDLVLVNFESVVTDRTKSYMSKRLNLRTEPEFTKSLKNIGIDMVAKGNNHALDYSPEEACKEQKFFENLGMKVVGSHCTRNEMTRLVSHTFDNGQIVNFLSFNRRTSSKVFHAHRLDKKEILSFIKEASKKEGVLIVSMHWGKEYKRSPSDNNIQFARAIIDNGADLIIGHHPHVVQKIEKYKGKWICYSLGNFIFDQFAHDLLKTGFLVEVDVLQDKIVDLRVDITKQNDLYQPEVIMWDADWRKADSFVWKDILNIDLRKLILDKYYRKKKNK